MTIQKSLPDLVFKAVTYGVVAFSVILAFYPIYFVIIASISDQYMVANGLVILWPRGITFAGYAKIFEDTRILGGYRNTIFYTAVGTAINLLLTIPAAYSLSRKDFMLRGPLMFYFVFTMFFNGGLIPTYLLISKLNMINTIWVMLLPFSVNVVHLIITRTFFEGNIPDELFEASRIDGCTNTRYFMRIVLPLSKPIILVMCLYYAVIHWNEFFMALIYLKSQELYPLQLILRDILVLNMVTSGSVTAGSSAVQVANLIKYGIIIVSIVPMIVLYPFIQKYFVKGIMIGAVKG